MEAEHVELIEQAISSLKLRDVMLYGARFSRPSPFPGEQERFQAKQLAKREVRYVVGEAPIVGSEAKLLQVYVDLGIKVTGLEESESSVFFEIEADFLVEYEVLSTLSEVAIKAFADVNSVHNVWPFWRQHVFDVVARGRLPQLEIPLFKGVSKRVTVSPHRKQ